ncbi:phage capsid protein [Clostridium perfringens]|nr:phage capsid protein [Clostridium perfringens]
MPVTLAEAKLNVQDALQMGVIDEFRKSNWILDHLIFDDAVSPTGGGATLTYSYTRLKTQPTAQFRDINSEYSPSEVTKERHSVDIKVFGGSYQIDRVIANMGGIISEVELQQSQKIKAAQALFNDTFINGDSATDSKAFDGLEKALKGSSTEYNAGEDKVIDLSTSKAVTDNYVAFLDMLDEFLTTLDGTPSFIAGNTKLISKLRACARRASMYQVTKNDWGQQVESYGNIPFVDLGTKPGSNKDVVATDPSKGTTSLYVARIGIDGLHGVSMAGVAPVQTWLPDFKTAGAVKTGEVEMNAAIALKASKAAGVFRNIKVK